MPTRPQTSRTSSFIALIACVAVIAILYFARDVLIPLALAILVSFILAPLVNRLERIRLGRIISVIVVVVLAGCVVLGVGGVVFIQVTGLADQIPRYADNIKSKAKTLMPGPDNVISKFTRAADKVNESIERAAEEVATENGSAATMAETSPESNVPPVEPVAVQVAEPELTPVETLAAFKPLLTALGTAAVVSVLVVFMLIERRSLLDRATILAGQSRINITTVALEEAGRRISQYLLMQLLVNSLYGLPVAIGLWLIGVPNAFLWGLISLFVRFIPYVGPWIGAFPPILLSLAIFDTWFEPSLVIGMFIVLELIVNNVLEPWLYGAKAGVSPLPLLIATLFWTWLWGPVGLVLAVPMTVCVAVVARHVPHLTFLNALLTDRPQLDEGERFHQRVLSLDFDEAYEVAHSYCESHSLLEMYEQVVLPSVRMVDAGEHAGTIDTERVAAIHVGLNLLISELHDCDSPSDSQSAFRRQMRSVAVVCVPVRADGDELVARMLCELLREKSVEAQLLPAGRLVSEVVEAIANMNVSAVCISALPPSALGQARHLCKRLIERMPNGRIVVGVWTDKSKEQVMRRLPQSDNVQLVTALAEAVQVLSSESNSARAPAHAA